MFHVSPLHWCHVSPWLFDFWPSLTWTLTAYNVWSITLFDKPFALLESLWHALRNHAISLSFGNFEFFPFCCLLKAIWASWVSSTYSKLILAFYRSFLDQIFIFLLEGGWYTTLSFYSYKEKWNVEVIWFESSYDNDIKRWWWKWSFTLSQFLSWIGFYEKFSVGHKD